MARTFLQACCWRIVSNGPALAQCNAHHQHVVSSCIAAFENSMRCRAILTRLTAPATRVFHHQHPGLGVRLLFRGRTQIPAKVSMLERTESLIMDGRTPRGEDATIAFVPPR